ncbi:Reticulocyte-binding protein 2 a [Amphibalanus amphitrite]|uniref:Reticulocyte-binding protein 2 a n=1 Tax=Amphibalanus amphitrite TaxID=1232801 RepID=A0A6A4VCG1_AMPAM|nr:Reticulocyte-binding protein 2 a [Amphibalanus amphitrite]
MSSILDAISAHRLEQGRRLVGTLSPAVQRLVARCGSAAHLVPDTLLVALDLVDNHGPGKQAYITGEEVGDAVRDLVRRPLLSALAEVGAAAAAARCRHCQPRQPLRLVTCNRSGSSAEGLEDLVMGKGGTSDFDFMLEFDGPFRWAPPGAEKPADIEPRFAPQLWARPTDNAGLVTLHWVRTARCGHEEPLEALPADSVRRLMLDYCRVMMDGEITPTGPAVNVKSDDKDGGIDFVFCLLVRGWWPAPVWPDGAPWDTSFGVHLVPTGRPGSKTEFIEYRISLSRAELLAVRQLCPGLRAAVTALKAIKNDLKESGVAIGDLKSYFIKTAALWLAQEPHGGPRTGVTDGVHRLLDWLERRLDDGVLPCYFYPAINVAAELSRDQRQAIIGSLRLVREHLTPLLMACCEKRQWSLDILLEGRPTEPLSERQLRLRLGRTLLLQAVLEGIRFRPTAPCWESWWSYAIPCLARAAPRLLQWYHHMKSGTHYQQCYLLMAWSVVDPADLADGEPMTSPVGDAVTLDVTPLTRLLTDSDLVLLLGEPAAVAAWCRRERPAGLTAEPDTPRGRAELLLRPELLLRALDEAVPGAMDVWREVDREDKEAWEGNFRPPATYQRCRGWLEQHLSCDLQYRLRVKLPEMDGPTVVATAGLWRRRMQQLLTGDRLRAAYDAAVGRWPDRWQLLQHYLAEDDEQDSSHGDRDGEIEDEEQHCDEEEQPSEGPARPHGQRWQLIEQQHQQRWKELELQHQQLWQELEHPGHEERVRMDKEHEEERRHLEQKHGTEWQNLDERHYEERIAIHQQHSEDTGCLNMPTEDQLRQLDCSHQQQWENLQHTLQQQWQELEQRHQRESRELEERHPNTGSEEKKIRLLEECSNRRHELQEELQKELEKELERQKKEELKEELKNELRDELRKELREELKKELKEELREELKKMLCDQLQQQQCPAEDRPPRAVGGEASGEQRRGSDLRPTPRTEACPARPAGKRRHQEPPAADAGQPPDAKRARPDVSDGQQ